MSRPQPTLVKKNCHATKSFGLALFDTTDPRKFLLVQSAQTYAFGTLIGGKKYYRDEDLTRWFADEMTLKEKRALLADYDNPHHPTFQREYRRAFYHDCTERSIRDYEAAMHILIPHIAASVLARVDAPLPWSFPKGRVSRGRDQATEIFSSEQISAMREMFEETKVDSSMYRLLHDAKPHTVTHCDMRINYSSELFFAESRDNLHFKLDPNDSKQIDEVSRIAWMSPESMSVMTLDVVTKLIVLQQMPHMTARIRTILDQRIIPAPRHCMVVIVEENSTDEPDDSAAGSLTSPVSSPVSSPPTNPINSPVEEAPDTSIVTDPSIVTVDSFDEPPVFPERLPLDVIHPTFKIMTKHIRRPHRPPPPGKKLRPKVKSQWEILMEQAIAGELELRQAQPSN